ncbi:MAG TPA: hypothetical protein DHW15_13050 [Bacteroidetes bacterium]|jgi:DNA-binding NarL/FixJ family response regulator|nr:MAG: hypothetical protein ABR94_08250 [Sphingobacteriales bacterium BACL12 MAG-120802-bin5]KRP12108.1 MAG: hypothetical protein ABR95_01500 [Sphingobacteriales bacterium BACL12 MAG-120813-bin55]HCK23041.1 hypothetical protein [Bacteroidota bacterium]
MTATRYSVLLANEQFLVREGLRCIIASMDDFIPAGDCSSLQELELALLSTQAPIVVVDPQQLSGASVEQFRTLTAQFPDTRFIVITQCEHAVKVRELASLRVAAILTPTCDRQEIESTLQSVVRGETTYCHKVVDLLMGQTSTDAEICDPQVLTEREVEIIRLVARGLTTKQMAQQLFRSVHTISTHRKNIMRKLGVKTPTELMLYAMQTGLVTAVQD